MSNTEYTQKYLKDGKSLVDFDLDVEKSITWESPSNIALIKYWGKFGDQLPQNPSLSFTLKNSKTITRVVYQSAKNSHPCIEYYFDSQRNIDFERKIIGYLDKISTYLPFLKKLDLKIFSQNTFPHSAGIASSASSFSALALCLCSIENEIFSTLTSEERFYKKASFLARLGSGSACRSIYGKVALWGNTEYVNGSSNELAFRMDNQIHDVFKSYYDAILIIDSGVKALSSTQGHGLMLQHPFAQARYAQASENSMNIFNAMKSGDEKTFSQIVEHEALTLHALMLSSKPFVSLLKPNTLTVISKLVEFRDQHNIRFTFTLDAGPNIHILYPQSIRKQMVDFINSDLKRYCENENWIDDEISDGPKILTV